MDKKSLAGLGLKSKAMTVFTQLIWASENIRARLFGLLNKYGLTGSQFGVLDALYHLGPRSQRDLGHHILKSSGNITMVIDNLEKNGFVRRERNEEDRRFINVHITEKGKKLFKKIMPLHVKSVEEEMRSLSSHELEELGRLCVKLGSKQVDGKQ